MNPIATAIKITYGSNRLHCDLHRSREQNKQACLQALATLTGLTVEQLLDPEHPEGIKQMDGLVQAYQVS